MYDYKILHSESMGYSLLKRVKGVGWQQISKWYWYFGNLKRFHPEANGTVLYQKIP